jgi:hypothetical protein
MRIDDETLQNFINEHTVDLKYIQKGKWRIYKMLSWLKLDVKIPPCQNLTTCNEFTIFFLC